jgi:hypothetical protein
MNSGAFICCHANSLFNWAMKDKVWLGHKKNVLHPGGERQNYVGQQEKCPSSEW